MTETERAWLAGFVDGEGCLSPRRAYGRTYRALPYACVQISQKDPAVLERIQAMLGYGAISRCASGTHLLRFGAREDVIDFVRLVYPYAVVKKEALRLSFILASLQGRPRDDGRHERRVARRREIGELLRVRPLPA